MNLTRHADSGAKVTRHERLGDPVGAATCDPEARSRLLRADGAAVRTPVEIQREAVYRNCHTRELQLPAWAGPEIGGDDRAQWEWMRACTRIYEVWCDGFRHATLSVVTSVSVNEDGKWVVAHDGLEAVDDAVCKAMRVTDEERAAMREYVAAVINPPAAGHPQP